jgi:hypothetical protein
VFFLVFSACSNENYHNAQNDNNVLKASNLSEASFTKYKEDNSQILELFIDFKKSILTSSAAYLIRISQMPIRAICGYCILSKHIKQYQIIEDGNITEEMLFLNHSSEKFGGNIFIDNSAKQFQFSLGIIQSKNWDEYAEYSIIFTFEKIQNNNKLTTINCAG